MYKFISLKTNKLRKIDLDKIIELKEFFWKFGKISQKNWINKNISKKDTHNLLFKKKILVGYTCLRIKQLVMNKKKINFLLFDTIIIHPNYRNKGLSKLLMKKNNFIIKKKKLASILTCSKKLEKFYEKFNWKKENKKKFNFIGFNLKKNLIFSFNINFQFKNLKLLINQDS